MELRQLRYVVAIAEHGALSKAASQVFVAQSALSFQLAQLEAELGVSLFLRTRRGVELTEPGKALAHAQAILRQVEDARASVHSTGGEPTGKVVFGIPHSVSNALALPLLQAVRQQLPQVELELTEELTGNLIAQLRTGLLNLAVLFDDGHLAEFLHQRVLTERLSLIALAKPDGPRTPASITFKKALEQPLICRQPRTVCAPSLRPPPAKRAMHRPQWWRTSVPSAFCARPCWQAWDRLCCRSCPCRPIWMRAACRPAP